jgi:hypothetical protein
VGSSRGRLLAACRLTLALAAAALAPTFAASPADAAAPTPCTFTGAPWAVDGRTGDEYFITVHRGVSCEEAITLAQPLTGRSTPTSDVPVAGPGGWVCQSFAPQLATMVVGGCVDGGKGVSWANQVGPPAATGSSPGSSTEATGASGSTDTGGGIPFGFIAVLLAGLAVAVVLVTTHPVRRLTPIARDTAARLPRPPSLSMVAARRRDRAVARAARKRADEAAGVPLLQSLTTRDRPDDDAPVPLVRPEHRSRPHAVREPEPAVEPASMSAPPAPTPVLDEPSPPVEPSPWEPPEPEASPAVKVNVGEHVTGILTAAEETAREIVAAARAEADRMRAAADADAEIRRQEADQVAARISAEASGEASAVVAAARAEAQRLRDEAGADADRRQREARTAAGRIAAEAVERADEVVAAAASEAQRVRDAAAAEEEALAARARTEQEAAANGSTPARDLADSGPELPLEAEPESPEPAPPLETEPAPAGPAQTLEAELAGIAEQLVHASGNGSRADEVTLPAPERTHDTEPLAPARPSRDEALYLQAVTAAPAMKRWLALFQPKLLDALEAHGLKPQDVEKFGWRLPIPAYDPANESHARLIELSRRADAVVARTTVPEGVNGFESERLIRQALEASGVTREIDSIVIGLLLR